VVRILGENMIEGENVLVGGGAGFIGSHLVDRLIRERPRKIVVVDNLFLGRLENLEEAKRNYPDLKVYVRDLAILPTIEEIIKDEKIDVVYDLATIPLPTSYIHPVYTFQNNIDIVTNFCELLRRGAFKFYVHASSSEALGTAISLPMNEKHEMNPTTTYGASKAAQDLFIQAFDRMYGIDFFVFRPFNNFGERQNSGTYAGVIPITILRILRGQKPIVNGDGEQTREMVYVKDTADAVVRLSKDQRSHKQIIHVARGEEIRIRYLVELICRLMGYTGEIERGPPRPNDVRRHLADISKMRSIIEFRPTPFEIALPKVIDWYRGQFRG
jgi:UDP-glucose 4-epimerase